ncbi:hypothetical protein [Mycolicibacterium gadium]|uniref:Uncharacterized protein n=1 Tax=Mycolicibacterium gadium TaxID=1794 RepID=A0A7I7WHI8_MYCGU|nr:hypothetical protein [Mycolicibacterium gadium]BBZ16372.1 hypothetical protein MGAD_07070 [Mycolicibacterium gadium]
MRALEQVQVAARQWFGPRGATRPERVEHRQRAGTSGTEVEPRPRPHSFEDEIALRDAVFLGDGPAEILVRRGERQMVAVERHRDLHGPFSVASDFGHKKRIVAK